MCARGGGRRCLVIVGAGIGCGPQRLFGGYDRGLATVVVGFGRGHRIGEQRFVAVEIPVKSLAVRVEQQLRRVAAQPARRIVGSVDAVPVELTGTNVRQVAMPAVAVDLVETNAALTPVPVDEAQVDGLGDFGEQRKVGSHTVIRCAEWIRRTRPDRDGLWLGSYERFRLLGGVGRQRSRHRLW